jgi:hypothetical protein
VRVDLLQSSPAGRNDHPDKRVCPRSIWRLASSSARRATQQPFGWRRKTEIGDKEYLRPERWEKVLSARFAEAAPQATPPLLAEARDLSPLHDGIINALEARLSNSNPYIKYTTPPLPVLSLHIPQPFAPSTSHSSPSSSTSPCPF